MAKRKITYVEPDGYLSKEAKKVFEEKSTKKTVKKTTTKKKSK